MAYMFEEPVEIPADVDAVLEEFAQRIVTAGHKWSVPRRCDAAAEFTVWAKRAGASDILAEAWANEILTKINEKIAALEANSGGKVGTA